MTGSEAPAGPSASAAGVLPDGAGTARAYASLVLTSLIWGSTPVAIRFLVEHLRPTDVLLIRYAISAALFAGLLTAIGGWRLSPADLPRLAGAALVGLAGYNILVNIGFASTPASLGGLILGTEPLFIALLAAVLLGERLSLRVLLGLLLAAAGTLVLLFGDLAAGLGASQGLGGPLLVLGSAICWSLYVVLVKPLLGRYGAIRTSALAALMATPAVLALGGPETATTAASLSLPQWGVLLFTAVFGTVISALTWNYALKHVSSASAAAFIYAVPLVSVVAGVVLLGEALTMPLVAGGAMILVGVAVAQMPARLGRR